MAKNPLIRSYPRRVSKPLPNKSAGILDDFATRRNVATNAGTIEQIPTEENHIVNKRYIDSGTWTGTNKTFDDFSNRIEADQVHIQVRNESGSAMTRGQLVYVSGYNLGLDRYLVSLADANDTGTFPVIGILDVNISNNQDGHLTHSGKIVDVNTNAFSVGDSVYMTTTAGVFGVKPTGDDDVIQAIGTVLRSNTNNGVLAIVGAGRVNDVPNNIKIKNVSLTIESPTSSEDFTIAFFPRAITISSIEAVVIGTTPSVTINPKHHTDRSNAGNTLIDSATAITNTTTGVTIDGADLNDNTLPAGSFLWLETTAQSGTVLEINLTFTYTED